MPTSVPPVAAAPISASAAEPVAATAGITVSLASLLASLTARWPETVRSDIVRLNLMTAKVELPVAVIEPALKRGKVPVKWGALRSWVKPTPPLNMSAHDEVTVELPLDVLTPLFFKQQQATGNQRRKVALDETIPDLFFGFPQSESSSTGETHSVTKPADTNFLARPSGNGPATPAVTATPDTNFYAPAPVEATPVAHGTPSLGTDFIKRSSTPREIVACAVSLENVAGAFITLPDGLMVASQIPADLNGDTLAAFVPQIFSKVSQATNELRMGELNNVAFTVGNVPWKIYRVHAVFFAAFGRASEPMPTARLAALAAELNQKTTR
jgi:predicted regulator of Ras-like GTPase activity (Roadblock/LC7/MglB family)